MSKLSKENLELIKESLESKAGWNNFWLMTGSHSDESAKPLRTEIKLLESLANKISKEIKDNVK